MNPLSSFQKLFEPALQSFISGKAAEAKLIHPKAQDMYRYLEEFISTGGKRLRPALFYFALSEGSPVDGLRMSFVFELFHTFALIHDDIIDDAPLRRGKPTLHHTYGIAKALLTGDLALTLADEIFSEVIYSRNMVDDVQKQAVSLYNTYKQELLLGQYLDTVAVKETDIIMNLKTSLYSFVRPVKFGFLLSRYKEVEIAKWDSMLGELGVLFQLKDDYDGLFASEKKLGKSVTSDIGEGKNTRIIARFKELASPEELMRFSTFFGKKNIDKDDHSWFLKTLRAKHIDDYFRQTIIEKLGNIRKRSSVLCGNNKDFKELLDGIITHIGDFSSM